MYAYIKGIVDEKGIDRAVVEAAGVGYELLCPDSTLREITAGREAKLLAHFNVNSGRGSFVRLLYKRRAGDVPQAHSREQGRAKACP